MRVTPQKIARDMVQAALRDTGDFAAPALVEAIAAAIERARVNALEEALDRVRAMKPKHVCPSCGVSDEEEAEVNGYNLALKEVHEALAGKGE